MPKYRVTLLSMFYEEDVKAENGEAAANKVWNDLDRRIDTADLKMNVEEIEDD